MKIAVMGAGAMGGYFGARLAASGQDVTLIARGAHLAALQENGLRLISPKGDLHLPDIKAVATPDEVGPVDVILFMVKNQDVEEAGNAIIPMIAPGTMVVTCQNGVSAPDRLAGIIGTEHVVPGVARLPGDIAAPGVIRHSAEFDRLSFGEMGGGTSERCEAFRSALETAGCMPTVHTCIRHDIWAKFVMQASFASITALTRLNVGPLRACPETVALIRASMEETERVGRAIHPDLPEGNADMAWTLLNTLLPPGTHASMLDDLNRGKPIENAYLSGDVVRLGAQYGVATPIHSVFAQALAPYESGTPA